MKTISVKYIILLATVLILSGCSVPKSSFVVSVPSNVQVQWEDQKRTNNDVKVTTSANEYVGLLVAQNPVTGHRVPFGVDYKHKKYNGDGIIAGFGTLATVGGAVASTMGLAMTKYDDMETEAFVCGFIGLAVMGGGLPVALSGFQRQSLLSHEYEFTYVPTQRVSFDGLSSTLAHVDPPKNASAQPKSNAQKSSVSSYRTQAPEKSPAAKNHQSKNPADIVSGKYAGSMKIMEGKEITESYSKAIVELVKVEKSKVQMTIMVRGENFFDDGASPIATIIPEKNGSYSLKIDVDNYPDTVIKIDKSNNLRITLTIFDANGERAVLSFSGKK